MSGNDHSPVGPLQHFQRGPLDDEEKLTPLPSCSSSSSPSNFFLANTGTAGVATAAFPGADTFGLVSSLSDASVNEGKWGDQRSEGKSEAVEGELERFHLRKLRRADLTPVVGHDEILSVCGRMKRW